MDTHGDHELLAAWRNGDQEALAVLVTRHHAAVSAACRRQAPPGEVDDCVQAVFVVLSRRPASAERAPVLIAWLLQVVRLVCRQAQRGHQRRLRTEHRAALAAKPTDSAIHPEALDHLDDCLQRLPARQRDALCLHYLAGKDPIAVAAELGTSRDQVYLLVHRGLAQLRSLLAKRGIVIGGAALGTLLSGETAAAETAPLALITHITSAVPTPGAAALATQTMKTMTITALTPFAAAAGLILAAGACTFALSGEAVIPPTPTAPPVATIPTPTTPPVPVTGTSIVPLSIFGLLADQEVSVDGTILRADGKGLTLPLGKRVELSWTNGGAQIRYQVISINAATGPATPDWVVAEPARQADGTIIAVGRAYSDSVPMAYRRALMDARKEASFAGPTQTTIINKNTENSNAPGNPITSKDAENGKSLVATSREESIRTTHNNSLSDTRILDQVITVCVDPATAPAVPVKPGTEGMLYAKPGTSPVRCWVRISARVMPSKEGTPPTAVDKAKADKAFPALDSMINKELEKPAPAAP